MVWTGDSRGRLAKSLITLFDQVEARYPGRSDRNDGTIGDEAHQSTNSDHNIGGEDNASPGVVRAGDFTHDPVHGFDGNEFAEALRLSRDPRIKYVIFNGRIFSSSVSPWIWRSRNKGPGDHSEHVHVSVVADPDQYDRVDPWPLPMMVSKPKLTPGAKKFANIKATVFNDVELAYGRKPPDFMGYALPGRIEGELPLRITNRANGISAIANKADIGPWYAAGVRGGEDRWWETGARPRAERDPETNGAGIDLYVPLAMELGVPIVERNGVIVAGEAQVDVEIIGEQEGMVATSKELDDILALIKQTAQAVNQLREEVNAMKRGDAPKRATPLEPTKPPPIEPVPVKPTESPALEKPSVQVSAIAAAAAIIAQLLGWVDPAVGPASTTTGIATVAAPILTGLVGMTGAWGSIGKIIAGVLGAFASRPK